MESVGSEGTFRIEPAREGGFMPPNNFIARRRLFESTIVAINNW